MKVTGPLFKWFGSKWLSAKTLPQPIYDCIAEPFAGSAGYSLRHCERRVILYESNIQLCNLWYWLINIADESLIRSIPINLPEFTDIRSLGLTDGQSLLLKHWQRTNNVGNCWTTSPWGNKPGQWTANTRSRVAEEVQAIKHWRIYTDGMASLENFIEPRTWFIDPCYQFNYQYGCPPTNYDRLACLIRDAKGQRIVCEAACQKTGRVPIWLPFEPWGNRITSRRKKSENHHSKEYLCVLND